MTDFIETIMKIGYFPILAKDDIPSDYGIGELVAILFWIARVVIIVVGGGISLIKIVKGKSDENPKEVNEGLAILASTGVIFAATFAVQAIFS